MKCVSNKHQQIKGNILNKESKQSLGGKIDKVPQSNGWPDKIASFVTQLTTVKPFHNISNRFTFNSLVFPVCFLKLNLT